MLIRKAVPADARGIAEVGVASWRAAYRGILPDGLLDSLSVDESARGWEQRITGGVWQMLVLERDGRIIGFAGFGPSRDEDADPQTVGEVYTIYLVPDEWRKGHGTELMDAALRSLRDEGHAEVMLWALRGNEPGKRFYQALGFRADGGEKVVTRKDGTRMHEVRYRRAIAGDS